MNHKAVILGNNYYIGLSTIRCLGSKGIHTVAIDYSEEERYGAKSKYCKEKLIAPHYKTETRAFIDFLITYAQEQEKQPVLIPCHDSYLEVVDAHLNELKQHYLIPQTEQGLYTEVMNKESLHALAVKHGVKVPETVRIGETDFKEKVLHTIKFPCLVKPVDSPAFTRVFRKKLFKVYTMDELERSLEKCQEAELEVIIQRIIPGFDDHMYTFDSYVNQETKVTHWTTCQKLRQYPINYGASVFTVQRHVPELYDIGAQFIEAIGFKGFSEIEFKKDAETGDFYLIEINARITNFNTMLNKIGLNFPYITYKELTGQPMEQKAVIENTNTAFWYAHEDLLAVLGYMKTKQMSFMTFFKSLFRPKAYAIWSWKDPKPFFSYNMALVKRLFQKLFKRR